MLDIPNDGFVNQGNKDTKKRPQTLRKELQYLPACLLYIYPAPMRSKQEGLLTTDFSENSSVLMASQVPQAWLLDVAQGLLFNTIERLPLLCEDLCRTIIFVLKVDHRLSRSFSKSISTSVQFPRPLSVNFSHRSIITATELIITAVLLVMMR